MDNLTYLYLRVSFSGTTNGPNSIHCQANGYWSPPRAECTFLEEDQNHAPTSVRLSVDTVSESLATGAVVGWLRTNDEDEDQTHTYTLQNYQDVFEVQGTGREASLRLKGRLHSGKSKISFSLYSDFECYCFSTQ